MMRWLTRTLWVGCLIVATTAQAQPSPKQRVVQTEGGKLAGVVRNGALEFRGIPFAAAPVGDLRWALPQPAPAWDGVRDARSFGPACPQQARFGLTDESLNEDCLNLNVSVPKDLRPGEKLPVLFWIHGGAFVGGASELYRLDQLASQGRIVVVSTNYRLGALGFMAHPALATADGLNGNYGLEDQRAALRWVQRNIAAFGGDPTKVTIAGESAGAGSVCAHLSSPEHVQGLFQQAIILSGACMAPLKSVQQAEQTGLDLSNQLGCTGTKAEVAACLRHDTRKASVANILKAQGEYAGQHPLDLIPFSMTPGTPESPNRTFPRTAQAAFETGQFYSVPLLMGGARNELRLYVGYWWQEGQGSNPSMPPINAQTFSGWLAKLYPGKPQGSDVSYAQQIEAVYKPSGGWSSPNQVPETLGALLSDFIPSVGINNCMFLRMADTFVAYGKKNASLPLYQFEFNDDQAPVLGVGIAKPYPDFAMGAVHSSALNYVFPSYSNNRKINAAPLKGQSAALSQVMVRQWAQFVKEGRPDANWPTYNGGDTVMLWQPGKIAPYNASAQHRCDFWNTLYP